MLRLEKLVDFSEPLPSLTSCAPAWLAETLYEKHIPRPLAMSHDPPRPYRPHLVSPTVRSTSPSTFNSAIGSSQHARPLPRPQSYDSLRAPPSITTWSDASISSLDQSKERLPSMQYAPPQAPQAPLPPLPRGSGGRPSTLQKQPPSSSASASARGHPPPRPPPLLLPGQVAPPPPMPMPMPPQQQHVVQEKPDMYSVKLGG